MEYNNLRIWNVETGKQEKLFKYSPNDDAKITCVTSSPDGKMVAFGGHRTGIIVWNPETGKITNSLGENIFEIV